MIDAAVAPLIGLVVVPDVPVYHWYDSGVVPVAAADSVVDPPALIAVDDGCVVIDGGAQGAL